MNNQVYTGSITLQPTAEEYSQIYATKQYSEPMCNNEYLFIKNEAGQVVDYFCYQSDSLRSVKFQSIRNSYLGQIKPRNPEQLAAIDLLFDPTTKVKVVQGVYGSGKDFLMLSAALELVQKGKFEKIVFIRPNITVKGMPDIGALPGTADEKLAWTLGPLVDKVGGEEGISMLIHNGMLEVVPLLFIRGRSFENSIVYVTEGQNMTTEIAKLLLGRIGEGSELWLNGDVHQADKSIFEQDNGLTTMIKKLRGNKLFGYIYLPTTERSEVANLANILDE